jgi:hypothetical protein
MRRAVAISFGFVLSVVANTFFVPPIHSFCLCSPQFGPSGPNDAYCNITWSFVDSIAGCPAGDSLIFTRPANRSLPARLRIVVTYLDNDCNPKAGVPPESIYVTFASRTGNLKVNDVGTKVYADDSTDTYGRTRITVSSFSGSGSALIGIHVSGASPPGRLVRVRTTDADADGRATSADVPHPISTTTATSTVSTTRSPAATTTTGIATRCTARS